MSTIRQASGMRRSDRGPVIVQERCEGRLIIAPATLPIVQPAPEVLSENWFLNIRPAQKAVLSSCYFRTRSQSASRLFTLNLTK